MRYTMTIEEPEKAMWFEQLRQRISQERLDNLFVSFLMQNEAKIFEEEVRPVSPRVHALRGVVQLPADFDEREFKSERLSNRLGS